jgi:hypothetical protein
VTSFNIDLAHDSMTISASRLHAFAEAYNAGSEAQREGIRTYVRWINMAQAAKHFT